MIRNPTPQGIAFISSLAVSLISSIIAFLISLSAFTALGVFLGSLIISFVVFFYALKIFIYRKIKLIYKTIHTLKTSGYEGGFKSFAKEADPLTEVNKEVITWAKDSQEQIRELKRLETFRKEFLGNVSHELKTPIFNIQGYIHTLLDGAMDDPNVNFRFLQKAAKSTDRLSDLVEDLVAISQLEAGELQMEMTKFDIHALTKDIYEAMEMKAQERGIKLGFKEGCDQPFWVIADKSRIRQVLVNLIVNSIKYGKENGLTLLSFYKMGENILVEVSDDGEGIEEKHLSRLFERFYRVDKSRSREAGGNGLGLAIVKHIIEAHNQTINVRSSVGKGTTFGFTLKRAN